MKLVVAPLPQVAALLARHRPSHLISLASPGHVDLPVGNLSLRRLDLRFNDIAAPRDGLIPPAEADVAALLAFADAWCGTHPLLVHCWAGVSRSTAAAYIIACARTAPGAEADWALRLREATPTSTPNPLMVALADRLLHRDGAMVHAVAAIGRGAETTWGDAFELDLPPRGDFAG